MLFRTVLGHLPWFRFRHINVVSLNSWMIPGRSQDIQKRFGRILRMVLDYRPDILLLQEVWTEEMKDWAEGILGQFFHAVERPEEDKKIVQGRYGSGLMIFTNLKVRHSEFSYFSGKALTFREQVIRRGYQLVQLQWKKRLLTVINTHLTAYAKYEDTRMEQLRVLHERLKPVAGPVLLGGDFNMIPGSNAYRFFTRDLGWEDLPGGNEYTWVETNPYYDNTEPNSRLDYFFGRNIRPGRYNVLQSIYSDHLGIYLRIRPAKHPLWQKWENRIMTPSRTFDEPPKPASPNIKP